MELNAYPDRQCYKCQEVGHLAGNPACKGKQPHSRLEQRRFNDAQDRSRNAYSQRQPMTSAMVDARSYTPVTQCGRCHGFHSERLARKVYECKASAENNKPTVPTATSKCGIAGSVESVGGSVEDSVEGSGEDLVEPSTPLGLAYDMDPLCSSRERMDNGANRRKTISSYLSIDLPARSCQSIRLFDIVFHAGVNVLFRRQRRRRIPLRLAKHLGEPNIDVTAPPPRHRWPLT